VLPALPTGRNHLAVDAIGGKLYVAGGRFDDVGSTMTAAIEIFDPASGAWTTGAPMPTARGGVTGIAAFGCLYVIAGEGNLAGPPGMFHNVEVYDPRTNTWQRLGDMPLPTHGLTRAAVLGGRIHIPGGSVSIGGNNGTTLHQVYEPERRCDQ
jgi:N-acetylneuraminic acid mutarotase